MCNDANAQSFVSVFQMDFKCLTEIIETYYMQWCKCMQEYVHAKTETGQHRQASKQLMLIIKISYVP